MTITPGVAAGHPATAQAGADILAAGGTAADAAAAMVLTSCAAETLFTGLGGGGFATHYEAATGETRCIDFFVAIPGLNGRRPGAGQPIEVVFVGQAMPYEIGPPTVAVPGIPAGVLHLWRRWGRLSWPEVVAPGRAASLGSVFPGAHADLLPRVSPAFHVSEGIQVYSRPDGSALQAGDLVAHPAHLQAYDLLAADPEAFYRGEYARAMLEVLGDTSAMEARDLESYVVIETAPRRVDVHGYGVLARGNDLDDVLGTMLAAAATMAGDPLTSPEAARALVAALRAPDRRSETTNLVAADTEGNVCAVTTSLGLGSGVWVPGFGVHLNSMLGEGELIREEVGPGMRMGSMMSPMLAVDPSGRPVVAVGAAGGSRIRPALVQTMLRMLDQSPPQAAIDAPRLNAVPGVVRLEPGFSTEVLVALAEDGDEVAVADGPDPYFGGVSGLSWLGAGADPRRAGHAEQLMAADLPGAPPPLSSHPDG
ncbi:MAG TPA: gamma-glutamyltransferase [Microlunatus sp.]|nr:gamma-glutamyltransferase [Microlunatus sp.]